MVSTAIHKIAYPVLGTELTTHGMVSKFSNSQSLNTALNLLIYRSSVTQGLLKIRHKLLGRTEHESKKTETLVSELRISPESAEMPSALWVLS